MARFQMPGDMTPKERRRIFGALAACLVLLAVSDLATGRSVGKYGSVVTLEEDPVLFWVIFAAKLGVALILALTAIGWRRFPDQTAPRPAPAAPSRRDYGLGLLVAGIGAYLLFEARSPGPGATADWGLALGGLAVIGATPWVLPLRPGPRRRGLRIAATVVPAACLAGGFLAYPTPEAPVPELNKWGLPGDLGPVEPATN